MDKKPSETVRDSSDDKTPISETVPLPDADENGRHQKSPSERKLLWKLDAFILSWACFGYFLRLLDTSNITNAYVSGMREDLNLTGNQFNLFQTLWTCGYIVGQIPSQLVITKIRPSIWIPGAELLWAVFTFSFAAMHNEKQIYAVRFLIGVAESPFYVGAITLLGNWYTPEELGKRATIFYSASFAANMFSGYLQAGVYNGMNGMHGLAGWRWLFIMCGVISVPGALWGFFAVPDSPYNTKAKWLTSVEIELAKDRMVRVDRRPFQGISWDVVKRTLTSSIFWPMVVAYICFCLDTYYLTFFAIWLKSLGIYSVAQINVIPTGAAAIGLVSTIFWGWLSDRLRARLPVALIITLVNVVGSLVLAIAPSRGGIFFGYFVNAATYAYGPIVLSWINETWGDRADQRALIIGVAQTLGATFSAWVPVLIFDTGTDAPLFRKGYITVTVLSAVQLLMVVFLIILMKRERSKNLESVQTLSVR